MVQIKSKHNLEQELHTARLREEVKERSDKLMNYFLISYFLGGLALAIFYDTWLVAFGVGGSGVVAYYSAKIALPDSKMYQYILSGILGIFMAQYIYQMHGLFEMHFIAFIGSAILITYQNWKLQIPILAVVVVHHGVFSFLQNSGMDNIYFSQLETFDLQTFVIHIILAAVIFFICGLWAYQLEKYSKIYIHQTLEITKLEITRLQKEALLSTERKHNEEALEISNKDLRKSNQELDKFVYSVSHDLRAPLASMLGIIDISEDVAEDVFIKQNIGMMKASITKLDSFISAILEYSRNSRLEVKKEKIDFEEILNDISNNLKYMNRKNRMVEINVNIANEATFVSDKHRLSIVLNNLISNAIRYQNPNAEKAFVNVKVNSNANGTCIEIKDNGMGVKKEYHEKIFDMFYRVSQNSEGSGLGLYIVKETIEKLKGKIKIESELDVGTVFNIHLPNLN